MLYIQLNRLYEEAEKESKAFCKQHPSITKNMTKELAQEFNKTSDKYNKAETLIDEAEYALTGTYNHYATRMTTA